jgi:hypothetical protein
MYPKAPPVSAHSPTSLAGQSMDDDPLALVGQLVAESYEVQELLGIGGTGCGYLARPRPLVRNRVWRSAWVPPRKSRRACKHFASTFALMYATLGCDATEGPLIVLHHAGAGGFAGSAGQVGSASVAGTASGGAVVRPATDLSWQVQLSGSFDGSFDVELYYVDLDNLTSTERASMAHQNRQLACYLSAGSFEPWRGDAAAFPTEVLGNTLAGYPNERWLDIRSSAVARLMLARLDQFKSNGCSSVVVANVTTSGEDSGFAISSMEQNDYLFWLSEQLHLRGIGAALATADDRLRAMEPYFDWAFAQSCWVDTQCSDYAPFVSATKAVLAVEFGDASTSSTLCQGVAGSGVNLLVKPQDLGASRIACLP